MKPGRLFSPLAELHCVMGLKCTKCKKGRVQISIYITVFKFLTFITEALGWLQIVVSPLLIGLGVGAIIYFPNQTTTRFILGMAAAILGLVVGIILATKAWRKDGTVSFLSRISKTPELDEQHFNESRRDENHKDDNPNIGTM